MTYYTNIYDSSTMTFTKGYITLDGCIITSIADTCGGDYTDYSGYYAVPGFVDIHTHGGANVDLSDPYDVDFARISDYYLSHGVTTYLPSTTSCTHAELVSSIGLIKAEVAKQHEKAHARVVGVHIEGPYINPKKAGAHDLAKIRTPKPEDIDELIALTEGMAVYMTIAPEIDGALETIRKTTACGWRITLGHTEGTTEQIYEGIAAGGSNFTHTFNAMTPLHHRSAGPVGVALTADTCAELICDGVHVVPEIARLLYLAKGSDKLVIVSDSMQAAGMPEGVYVLGGVKVTVKGGQALIGQTLAGSVTNLHDEMKNLMKFAKISLEQAIPCVTANPAKAAGIYDKVGSLEVGKFADVVFLDEKYDIVRVIADSIVS